MKERPSESDVAAYHLVENIKNHLRTRGLTYRSLARSMGLSEVTIKRLLNGQRLTFYRLQQIAKILQISLSELIREAETAAGERCYQLTAEQERVLAKDFRLYSFFVFLVYQVPIEQIMERFNITRKRTEKFLLRLDRIGIVELKTGLKFKILVPTQFAWRKNGPIESRILNPLAKALLRSHLKEGQQRTYEFYVTRATPALVAEFSRRFRLLSEELLTRSIREESAHPEAQNTGFMLVLRPFEGPVIQLLEQLEKPSL